MCGKSNPSEREICQYCQARLKPLVISQHPDEPAPKKDSLDFLGQSPPSSQDEAADEGLPDWLASLRKADEAAVPSEPAEDLPDWLEMEKQPIPEETRQDEAAVPDWLTSFRASGADVEEGLSDEREEYSPSISQRESEEEGLPDWLEGMSPSTSAPLEPGESGEEALAQIESEEPEWLDRLGEAAETPPTQPVDRNKPDWQDTFDELEVQPEAEKPLTPGTEQAFSFESQLSELEEEYSKQQLAADTEGDEEGAATLPAWLSAVGATEAEVEQESIPDWLAGALEPQAEQPGVLPEQPFTAIDAQAEEHISDEFVISPSLGVVAAEIAKGELEEEPFQDTETETAAPDWLEELASNQPAAVVLPEEKAPITEADIPDWLAGYDETPALDLEEQLPYGPGSEEPGLLLDWLEEEAEPAPEEAEAAVIDAAVTSFVAPFALDEEGQELLESEPPEWMAQAAGLEGSLESVAPPTEIGDEEGLTKAELPDWLEAMRPLESAALTTPIQEESERQVEGVGPLAGLRSVLPSEFDVGTLKTPAAYTVKLQVSENQKAHINLIDGLVKSEGEAGETPARKILGPQRLLLIGISVILVLALLWPVLTARQTTSLPGYSDEILETSSQINNLPGNVPVLLAVDYEPGMTGELEATVSAVLDHLMLKGAYLTLISTLPSGPAQAERLVNSVSDRGEHDYQSPGQYTNLGYIPGSITGIRAFSERPPLLTPYALDGSPVWEEGPLAGFQSLADFGMVVVLTENPNTARAWVEQAGPLLGETPLVMVVSAQIEPVVRPYFESESQQVSGIVAGLPGGAAYEQMLGRFGVARKYWDTYSLGVSLIALLIVLGAVINVADYLLSNRKSSVGETKR
ncbi:MAG: hypothetical protein A2W33_05365 [Chloroflexi bacterium RBG_16_52_11]|nr:MAG: hypothetical protein A2W33_05365 [Chloroflexi bacterium RBG_16_52_11]